MSIFTVVRRPIPAASYREMKNMRITSILRVGTLALALTAAVTSFGTAFASESLASQSQVQQGNTGIYDGADDQAAKRAFN